MNGLRRWIAGRLYLLADKTDVPPPFFTDNFERADEEPLGPSWEPPASGWIRDNRSTEAAQTEDPAT